MIPPVFDPNNPSPGERIVFDALASEELAASWTVLHSQDLAHHVRQERGECDFVVMIPGKAVLCLEVKGHRRISRRDGKWILGDPDHSGKVESRGPFKQASEAMDSIRQRVKRNAEFANVPFQWVAVFPLVESVQTIATDECHSWQVVTASEIAKAGLSSSLLRAADSERNRLKSIQTARWFDPNKPSPLPKQIERMTALLRPDFEMFETPVTMRNRRMTELRQYTIEQFQALDRMEGNARTVFNGLAGTGKTVLALESARRQAILGDSVLLLCFNRALRNWLSEQIQSFGSTSNVTVLTVSQLAWRICKGRGLWSEDQLPQLKDQVGMALDVLLESDEWRIDLPARDIVVIDEAQDVMTDEVLDLVDLLVKGGLARGRWRAFGDFTNQAIFHQGSSPFTVIDAREVSFTSYSLRENCRNTPVVARLVESLGRLPREHGYTRVLRPQGPFEPHNDFYKSDDDQAVLLVAEIARLLGTFKAEEIVILSTKADESVALTLKPGRLAVELSQDLEDQRNVIRCSTIHRFKGLESPAVILTDIEDVTSEYARQLLYVGMSRATDQLSTLVWEGTRSEFKNAIMGRAS